LGVLTGSKGEAVMGEAQRLYDLKRIEPIEMAKLGTLLADAGCDESHEAYLHCLHGGQHIRGCWMFDLILGKE
jgi:hypothetical protein